MSQNLKSASTSSMTTSHSDILMVNGFIVHSKPLSRPPVRHVGNHKNGYRREFVDSVSMDRSNNDPLPYNSLKSASCIQFSSQNFPRELPHMLDLTQHKAKAVYITPTSPILPFHINSTDPTGQNIGIPGDHRPVIPAATGNFLNHVDSKPKTQQTKEMLEISSKTNNGTAPMRSGTIFHASMAPGHHGNSQRLDYGNRFSSMQCLHERTSTYKPNLKSSSSYSIREHQEPLNHHSGHASTGTNGYWQGSSTLQRRGSDQLRRAVSYEQSGLDPLPSVVRTSSEGELESEYVTLDRRYIPFPNTRLGRVAEGVAQPMHESSATAMSKHNNIMNEITPHVFNNNAMNFVHASINSNRASSKSMHSIRSNTSSDRHGTMQKRKPNSGTLRAMAETLGSVFSSPRSSGSSSRGSGSPRLVNGGGLLTMNHANMSGYQGGANQNLTRSKSLPDLQSAADIESGNNYSDDEDGDDFGFLSYPITFSSTSTSAAMNKAKSPSPGNRIFPKRWRSKTPSTVSMWTPGPQGSSSWSSMSGRKVQLRSENILNLSEAERGILQKIALTKLQSMDIGCPVTLPKENDVLQRTKKSSLSLKRRSKSVSAPALDAMGKGSKDVKGEGLVFGIPLDKCILNDKELEKRRKRLADVTGASSVKLKGEVNEISESTQPTRKSSSSSQGSGDNLISPQNKFSVSAHKRAASNDSLSESESSRNTSSSLIDALSLSTFNTPSRSASLAIDSSQVFSQGQAQVPYVVKACFKHIQTYGLQTLGIFRVGSSKKRVKQLREEFDSGKEVVLTNDCHPHDVAALLKEFFRDLPEPLLTRELYLPFLFVKRKTDDHKRHHALRLLISMLPVANRDTFWALLRFLAIVSQHAVDSTDEKGEIIPGNKMDSHNLATLFGPNILHRTKSTNEKESVSESAERVEQSKEIIEVVKDMIDNHHELFQISGSLRDEVLRLLVASNHEAVDNILKFLANQNQIEADPESMCSVFDDSINSPYLYHAMNSDADLLHYSHQQALTTHRPLRVTKSADNSLDSPVSKSRATHLSESQAVSPTAKDNQATAHPGKSRSDGSQTFTQPILGTLPVLRVSQDPIHPDVVLRSRLEPGYADRPYSEGYNDNLNIPRPVYLRENSYSSVSSGLSSSLNSQGGSDTNQSGQWILPTPPTSRGSSPKPSFRNNVSSSTLIAPSLSPVMMKHNFFKQDNENKPESSDWERWRQWEKHNSETEQETLV